jgi:hypothetical protein
LQRNVKVGEEGEAFVELLYGKRRNKKFIPTRNMLTRTGRAKMIKPDFVDGADLVEVKSGTSVLYIDDQWRGYLDVLGYKEEAGRWARESAPDMLQFKTLTIHIRPGVEFGGELRSIIGQLKDERIGGKPVIDVIEDLILD